MKAFKRITVATCVAVAALSLTACGASSVLEEGSSNNVNSYAVTLTNGTVVDCVVFDGYKEGGLTCFWGEKSTVTKTSNLLSASIETAAGTKRDCIVLYLMVTAKVALTATKANAKQQNEKPH